MKTILGILSAAFVVAGGAGGVALMNASRTNDGLRADNEKLAAELLLARQTSSVPPAEVTTPVATEPEAESSAEPAGDSESAPTPEAEPEEQPPTLLPYRTQAYLGDKLIGEAWIVPRNLRKDPNTQRYVYEQVVWLDEKLRNHFVVHHTNIIERPVETTYVNNSYYPQPIYYISPHHPRPPGTNHPPNKPPTDRPPKPQPPIQPQPSEFNPGSGKIIQQRLGTRAGQIRTTPEAPRTTQPPVRPEGDRRVPPR